MVYDSYEFGKYLTELRRKYNVSMNVVCDGICDQSVMSRIENGEREVSKLVQDRLLGRLGVAPENFENMVYADEYGYWKTRQEIISLIQHEKMDEADKLLEKMAVQEKLFESGDAAENIDINLKLQFYMAMKAQIRCYNGAGDAELKKMYADASRLTISRMKDKGSVKEFFSNRRLAVDEINLLLEYWRYVSPEIGKRFIRGAIEYIDKARYELLTWAKIYLKMSTLNANVFSLFFTFSILHNFAFNFYALFTFCKFRLVLDVDPDPVRLLPPVKMGARNKAALLLSLYAAILSNSSLYNCSAVLY